MGQGPRRHRGIRRRATGDATPRAGTAVSSLGSIKPFLVGITAR
jgi:hypothetical protein